MTFSMAKNPRSVPGREKSFPSYQIEWGDFAYANKMPMDGREKIIHFGEADADYTPEGEFYDAVVRYRKS